ncbi:Wzz/FepE/Etk N-terminal domain-containing protein [Skermania sp. ID1734]|uniref:Wzz/FepE/Etk N-terminal domain-containing protein n=1 Tax=Skermania sp. ID1734 TaxID=2597516 RepID=UPI00163DAC24|nr:Wzz/FepE/Etk N-terminal domain-containing protein [Skermania sp. ID1734]
MSDIAGILRRVWWVVAAMAVLGAICGWAYGSSRPVTYSSTAQLYVVVNNSGTSGGDANDAIQAAHSRIASYAALATTPEVATSVAQALDLNMTPAEIAKDLSVTFPPGTLLLNVTATASNPRLASDLAAETTRQLQKLVNTLETPAPGVPVWSRLLPVSNATPPVSSASSSTKFVLAGLAAGFVLGAAAAYALIRFDSRVRSESQLAKAVGVAVVPADDPRALRAAVSDARAGSRRAVAVMSLDVNTWPITRELAKSIAATGASVLVLDARTSGAGLTEEAGLTDRPGMSEYIRGGQDIALIPLSNGGGSHRRRTNAPLTYTGNDGQAAAVATADPGKPQGVQVIGAGIQRADLPDLLAFSRMESIIARATSIYDYVLIDGLSPGSDARIGSAVKLSVIALGVRSAESIRSDYGFDRRHTSGALTNGDAPRTLVAFTHKRRLHNMLANAARQSVGGPHD